MPATLIQPEEAIEILAPPMLIYGQPGMGKTSLSVAVDGPVLTLDADGGAHRTPYRKASLASLDRTGRRLPLSWSDMTEEEERGAFDNFGLIAVDTVGALVGSLVRAVCAESPKNGSVDGGPNQYGWTRVKSRFDSWVGRQRAAGRHLVFVAHDRKEGDDKYVRPDIAGASYGIVMSLCDLVGYLYADGKKRILDFSPTEGRFGKNPCQWQPFTVPRLTDQPDFLGKLLDDARARLGKTALSIAQSQALMDRYTAEILACGDPAAVMTLLGRLREHCPPGMKTQVWSAINDRARQLGLAYDKQRGEFVRTPTVASGANGGAAGGQKTVPTEEGSAV